MFARPKPQMGTQRDVLPQRAAALVIDIALLGVLVAAVGFVLGAGPILAGVAAVLTFAYLTYFEGTYGQTVGKRLMNVVVVNHRGYPCSYRAAAVRTLVGVVDALPSFFVVGLASIFLTDGGQRVGDLAAETVVVRSTERGARM
jgi:uncharacterized RDD family membrane protein YckC